MKSKIQQNQRGRPPLTPEQLTIRRNNVTEAAQRLFAQEGYSAVSIRRVAEEAGVTTNTLYSYFATKVDLLRTLWSDIFQAVFALVEDGVLHGVEHGVEGQTEPTERLIAACTCYVRYWIDHPDHYRLVFLSGDVSQKDVSGFLEQEQVAARFAVFAMHLATATGANPQRIADSAELLVCAMHGIAHSLITISGYQWRAPELLVDLLVRSILSTIDESLNSARN